MTATGLELRAQGVADVLAADAAVHRDYAELIRKAVDYSAAMYRDFTSDDVRARIEDWYPGAKAHHPNVIGGALHMLAEAGHITPVGYRPSTRPGARHRIIHVWRGTP